jgi:hypothetical protein
MLASVERFTDFSRQGFHRERLLEEMDTVLEHSMPAYEALRMSGHLQDSHGRPYCRNLSKQRGAVHLREHYVRHQKVNGADKLKAQAHRFVGKRLSRFVRGVHTYLWEMQEAEPVCRK